MSIKRSIHLTYAKAVDSIHAKFGIETHLVEKILATGSKEIRETIGDKKLKINSALTYVIGAFWQDSWENIHQIIREEKHTNTIDYVDSLTKKIYKNIIRTWTEDILHGEQNLLQENVDYIHRDIDTRMKLMYATGNSRISGIEIIHGGLRTGINNIVNAIHVYKELSGKNDKKSLVVGVKEFISTSSSLHLIFLDAIEELLRQQEPENHHHKGLNHARKIVLGETFKKENFYLDENKKLQVHTEIFEQLMPRVAKEIGIITDSRTKCPAFFAQFRGKKGKKNVIIDLLEIIAECMSETTLIEIPKPSRKKYVA